jgi:hypothetical protein
MTGGKLGKTAMALITQMARIIIGIIVPWLAISAIWVFVIKNKMGMSTEEVLEGSLMVIASNSLILYGVLEKRKLRKLKNYFAGAIVLIIVMPFVSFFIFPMFLSLFPETVGEFFMSHLIILMSHELILFDLFAIIAGNTPATGLVGFLCSVTVYCALTALGTCFFWLVAVSHKPRINKEAAMYNNQSSGTF